MNNFKRKPNVYILSLLSFFLISSLVFAQEQIEGKRSYFTTLGVSTNIISQINESMSEMKSKKQRLSAQMKILTGELDLLVLDGVEKKYDMESIKNNLKRQAALWESERYLQFELDSKIQSLLTPEQFKKYLHLKIQNHNRTTKDRTGK